MSPGADSPALRPLLMAIGDALRRPIQSLTADRSLKSAIARPGHTQEAERSALRSLDVGDRMFKEQADSRVLG
jgi:hypothetical protein